MKNFNLTIIPFVCFLLLLLVSTASFGQAVSINSTGTAPDAQSILDVSSTTKGVFLPRMSTAQRQTLIVPGTTPADNHGLTVYDTNTKSYWYWDGLVWREIPNSSGIVTTLDGAYDGGGSGVGRVITSDAGAVDIQGAGGLLASKIGIGVTSASAQLHTNGTVRFENYTNGLLQVNGTGVLSVATASSLFTAGTGLSWTSSTLNSVWTTNGTGIHNNNTGNVGIGVSAPLRQLHLASSTGEAKIMLSRPTAAVNDVLGEVQFDAENALSSGGEASVILRAIASVNHAITDKGGHFAILTKRDIANQSESPTEHFRVTSAGNVGIGDSTPDAKLDVDAASGDLLILAQSGTQRMRVDASGNAWITGKFNSNGIEELSDARYKKNIEKLNGALENVLKIEGVTYNWRQDEFPERSFGSQMEIGFIAQELEKIYPELVSTNEYGYKSVQYSHMVPVLLEAIKEQQLLISKMEQTVERLLNQNEVYESSISTMMNKLERFSAELEHIAPTVVGTVSEHK